MVQSAFKGYEPCTVEIWYLPAPLGSPSQGTYPTRGIYVDINVEQNDDVPWQNIAIYIAI